MSLLPDSTVNYNDFSSLSRLRIDARDNSQAALEKVAKQFESVFVQMMIKSMREASVPLQDDLFNSQQSKTYTDMYDKQLGLELTKTNGIGLADVIVRQLTKPQSVLPESENQSPPSLTQNIPRTTAPVIKPEKTETVIDVDRTLLSERPAFVNRLENSHHLDVEQNFKTPHWQSPEAFIRDSWPHARQAGEALGIDPRVILAQSALETGWGKRMHATASGENSYSLFGIKADDRWQGKTVQFNTLEYRSGAMQQETANFRAYDSLAESYRDYVDFLQSNSRYQPVLEAESGNEYTRALQDAGYATDPDYARKIDRIIQGDLMNEALSSLKISTTRPLT